MTSRGSGGCGPLRIDVIGVGTGQHGTAPRSPESSPLTKDVATVPAHDDEGQVSEASNLENADEPIQPDQAVAGAPEGESGDVQEGRTGPNAATGGEKPDHTDDSSDQAATHG